MGQPDLAIRPAGPAPRAAGRRRFTSRAIWQGFAGVLIVAALLELLTRLNAIPSRFFPHMSEIIVTFFGLLGQTSFWNALGATMSAWLLGLLLAILLGAPLGLLVGSNEYVYYALRPIVEFLRPIPSVALIPLAILAFGSGIQSKLFLIVFASFWPIFINAVYGAHDRDTVQRDTVRAFRIRSLDRFFRVVVPSTLPFIATGVRISSSVALILAVTAELVIGAAGLGREITVAQASNALPTMYALIFATGVIGIAVNLLVAAAEARLLRWHPRYREAS